MTRRGQRFNVVQLRFFRCMECGQEMAAGKVRSATGRGHIKDLYCPRCRAV